MAKLDYEIMQSLEELLEMRSGYVLDFSNNSLQEFVEGIINIDIYHGEGYEEYCSKANKLRQIFETESNAKVSKLILSLMSHYEDFKLKNDDLTDYDKKKICEIREAAKKLKQLDDGIIAISEGMDEIIQKISTRNAEFSEMTLDERLKEIANSIEYLLKKDDDFITLDYDTISLELLSEDDITKFRKKLQCFRHSSKDSLKERAEYTENQKGFLVELGVVMCNMICNAIKQGEPSI